MVKQNIDCNVLVFRVGKRYFSLPAVMVEEISSCVDVTPLPFLENYVDGLVSLNGQVAVQVNFSTFIGDARKNTDKDAGELLHIVNETGLYAIKVDEVCENLVIDRSELTLLNKESLDENLETSELHGMNIVEGEFDYQGKTVMYISSNPWSRILNVVNVPMGARASLAKKRKVENKVEDYSRYLILALGDEKFAFPIVQLQEIYVAEKITTLPGVSNCILGISVIRKQAMLVLSSQALLGVKSDFNKLDDEANTLLVVIDFKGSHLALAFDKVIGIEDVSKNNLKLNGNNKKRGVMLLSDGSLVNLIDIETLINDSVNHEIINHMPESIEKDQNQVIKTELFLQIQHLEERFIIPCEHVTRILDYVKPELLDSDLQIDQRKIITGVTQFEGDVLPVIDIKKSTSSDQLNFSAYIVLNGKNNLFAVPVVEAERVLEIDINCIEYHEMDEGDVVSGLAKYNGELFSLLDVSKVENVHFGVRS